MERADAVTRSCLIAADLVVIPIEPSALSAWASDRAVDTRARARGGGPGPARERFAGGRAEQNTHAHAQARPTLPRLVDEGLKPFPPHATAHPSDNNSACSNTVCVAFSCLSGG